MSKEKHCFVKKIALIDNYYAYWDGQWSIKEGYQGLLESVRWLRL